ncbi:MauE/DoxX family redox-associated membrane protein [Cohnella faecalis]|uniref:Methylamine utilisation protein MauE domain-containing protein n=1 Tax=Cohnella faecalis TaxID=2315694 RepID=A0A398CTS4_9BACL|nr:MauE/DoxX family redox-associated membrane protein [Cohnella faecalis]RIE02364.1 hypothetical protein D3H35_16755 [Cohnella faecalis]
MSVFIAVFLCCLFLFSAISKAFDWRRFGESVAELGLARINVKLAVIVVPAAEAAVAALLPWPGTRTAGIVLLLGLLISFAWAAWKAKGQNIECHCFGKAVSENFGALTFVRIGVCGALSIGLLAYPSQRDLFSLGAAEVLYMVLTSCGILAAYVLLSAIAGHKKTGMTL